MNRKVCVVLLVLALCGSGLTRQASGQGAAPKPADLVLRNGAVYTVDAARSWADAVAVSEGRIVYVGPESGIGRWIGPATKVLDLQGKMVLPGFTDSHVHAALGGVMLGTCDLSIATTQEQVLKIIREYATGHPDLPWITGFGWALTIFADANPHKKLLDEIVPDRPVFLDSADGHSAWVNSSALTIAGITREAPDPSDGRIERDPKTGEPTGTLRETAKHLVEKIKPQPTEKDYVNGLRRAIKLANSLGITSLCDPTLWNEDIREKILHAYAELDRLGELSMRVKSSAGADAARGLTQITNLLEKRRKYQGQRFNTNTVKIMVDGVIESHTAALLEPYLGFNDERGKPMWEPETLNQMVTVLDREGFQIHVHAIGDRAIRMSLDAFSKARNVNGGRDSRHHIAHIQLFDPADLPRFRRLGVIANFQPFWALPDEYTKMDDALLGPKRSRWLYPIGSMARTGAVIVGGSDWNVSSMNPLDAIQVGITRRVPDTGPGPAWIPEEVVDLPTMLAAYTINGAYGLFQEKETGSLEVGKAADLIVLDRNLFELPAHEISKARVLLTLLEGREVYRHPEFREK
ncbi:MAG TPA: amidohydrolase [Blastocatellia bacterium]|nr:amidohydrolase [Blastocatellia bacterium]